VEQLEFDGVTAEAFSVDMERRTMTGLVVPWNKVSSVKGGRRYRFARGSVRCVDPKFVKFNEDHSPALKLGRATRMEDTEAGLVMSFRVAEGERGDRALAKAQNGSKTGLSVEVEFDASDIEPDPEHDGAWLVNLSNCEGVAFVRNPSFDDSRLISVRATADEGEQMDPVEQTPAAQPGTQTITMSRDDLRAVLAEMQPANTGPAVIVPRAGVAQVTEPQNYRFDREGNLQAAAHDFGLDLIRGMNPAFNDVAGRQRAEEFISAQFDVVTTDINELNPTVNQNRYIDQRDYRSPVWNRINKGAPPNGVQPFAWPKYSSSSGLVGAHTEGTEPTSGTYVTTNQTVTPTATSGKAKITRETWDMGGMPGIGNLIWRQMTRGYVEALEAKAIATLDAASPTGITLTTGGGTTGQTLAAELVAAFAGLQFVRGGFSMDSLFAQIDLYKAVVGAKDGNGAYLFPALGATNRDGTVSQRFGTVDINGVLMVPSWALAATGVVAASSYLFDAIAVDGWATPPRQLTMPEIEVANVYLGIWGYSAAAINDINGVRELIYDPA